MIIKLLSSVLVLTLGMYYGIHSSDLKTKQTNQLKLIQKEYKRYDQPAAAVAWMEQFRQTKNKSVSKAQLNQQIKQAVLAKEFIQKPSRKELSDTTPLFSFENIGPSNFGGRIRAFVIKPDDDNYLLAGSVSGGIFKSTDAAASWHPVTDFLPSIAIGSMVVDPDNTNRVYVGTGEGYFNYYSAQGAGIFVSEDFGDTWTQLPSTNNENFYFVNRLVKVPNSDILLAATRKGIFRSIDLGQSWTEATQVDTSRNGFVDMKIDPSNSNNVLAVHYGNANDAIKLSVSTPASIADDYDAVLAGFGPAFPSNGTGNKDIVEVNDGVAPNNDGCEPISTVLTGKIALIQRGKCNFTVKVKNAQLKGAVAVIVYQNLDDDAFTMAGDDTSITIPSAMIFKIEGEAIAAAVAVKGEIKNVTATPLQRFLMKSNDKGASWQYLSANNGVPVKNVGRMEVAFGNDGVVYMIADDGKGDDTRGLWRANNINNQFSKTASNTLFLDRFNDITEKTQGWYDLALAVSPANSNKVLMGGIDQYVSNNGGNTISLNSYWLQFLPGFNINKFLHADHHGYYFSSQNPNIMYAVTDGGVFKSTDSGSSYLSANDGLSISQSYGIAVRKDGKRITSGTQDNGSQMYFGDTNTWREWQGGDGGYSSWDQQQSNYVYGSYVRGEMYGSNDGGITVVPFFDREDPIKDGASFIQPFVLDNNDGNRMLIGTNKILYTTNVRSFNQALFTDISGNLGTVSAVNFNDALNSQVFAGTFAGNVYKVDNVGTQNTLTNISPNNVSGAITDIKSDANDTTGNTLYLTRGDYNSDRIMKSTNGGNTWTSISSDLPDMPLYQVSIDPKDHNQIYVGSELGLWTTELGIGTPHWVRYDYGLAFTRVIDLVWNNDTLFIGTHGRGTYKASRSGLEISLNKFITTSSNHDDDGILDRGEEGLLMLNIKNSSSHAISDAKLAIAEQGLNLIDSGSIVIDSLPAYSNTIVPIKVSLDGDSSCLNKAVLDVYMDYSNGKSHNRIVMNTAVNKNETLNDFIANAESNDSYMSKSLMLGNSAWSKDSNASFSGNASWFASDEGNPSDKSIISPWLVMNAGGNRLSFALKYFTEINSGQIFDGALLEIREKGGLWQDIGHSSTIEYDGRLSLDNTTRARFAWGGSHNAWRTATVDLAESYKGKTIQFRFRMISNNNTSSTGFWVDEIKMTNVIWEKQASCDEVVSTGGKIPSSGLWFDRGKNGHGFVIEPIGTSGLYFTVFYTYDDNGKPEWYTSLTTLENGVLNASFENDTLQRFIYDFTTNSNSLDSSITDGRLSIDFNSETVNDSTACQDGVDGRNADNVALAHWKINGQEGSWCINPIIAQANIGFPDLGGTWYGGVADQGWGLSVALAKQQLISILYYYDQSGQPRWAIGDAGNFEQSKEISLTMREADGYGRVDTPITPTYVDAGTIKLNLNHVLNNLQIDGNANLNVEFQGVQGGQWLRDNIPIQIITNAH